MELIRDPVELRAVTDARREAGDVVGLVPTLGALHEGHASLIHRAQRDKAFVVVSIFLNPLQFGPDEDLARYPRDEARDLAFCEAMDVDVVWAPSVEQMYPPGIDLAQPDPGPVGRSFEGAARPGHLEGVLKVVLRLFDVVGPCKAYFGRKDAQQLFLVRRMVDQLGLPVEIVACPTVREPDGVARSSRNVNLSAEDREAAGCLFLALSEAAALARAGERDANVLIASMAREIGATPHARPDYVAVVDEATLQPVHALEPARPALAIVAVRFPGARLIDNVALPEPA